VLPKWDRCRKVGHFPNVIFSHSFAILVYAKEAQSYKKWLEETFMGHGSIGLLQALFSCGFKVMYEIYVLKQSVPIFVKNMAMCGKTCLQNN